MQDYYYAKNRHLSASICHKMKQNTQCMKSISNGWESKVIYEKHHVDCHRLHNLSVQNIEVGSNYNINERQSFAFPCNLTPNGIKVQQRGGFICRKEIQKKKANDRHTMHTVSSASTGRGDVVSMNIQKRVTYNSLRGSSTYADSVPLSAEPTSHCVMWTQNNMRMSVGTEQ